MSIVLTAITEPQIPCNPCAYTCCRVDKPFPITGDLRGKPWELIPWTNDFVDIQGPSFSTPRFQTRVKLLWDDTYFYVAALLQETQVWATLTKRDSILTQENAFEVLIDPDGDTHNYCELLINPLGTLWDLFLTKPYRDGGFSIHTWNIDTIQCGIYCDGKINDPSHESSFWSLELAIPLSVIAECTPTKKQVRCGDTWRVNFLRIQWHAESVNNRFQKKIDPCTGLEYPKEYWVWSAQGLVNMHYPEMWGYITFVDTNAGTEPDFWIQPPDEAIKWALRKIYYRQHQFRKEHGRFFESVMDVAHHDPSISGYIWQPMIQTTDNQFHASARSFDGNSLWHIHQDGRIWKE